MPNRLLLLALLTCALSACVQPKTTTESPKINSSSEKLSARLDSFEVYSSSMDKAIKTVVVLPESYDRDKEKNYPVIYLLHGAYGDHLSWLKSSPLEEFADRHQAIIICPDGSSTSWYLDSPVDSAYRYETFVSQELVSWVDSQYRSIDRTDGRAICGLSMGGHGAFYLAFRHQDVWGACGSIAGGMDLRPFPQNWNLSDRLGSRNKHPQRWLAHSVVGQLDSLQDEQLALIFDCGRDDFFYEVNEALHDSLERRGISHLYTRKEGEHNWAYFASSLPDHLEFFDDFFKRNR